MKTYSIKITEQARLQLFSIRQYIELFLMSPIAAKNTIDSIFDAIRSLSTMPKRIKTIEEKPWGDYGIRKMKVKNYYIYFWVNDKTDVVQIIAVIYVKKDQEKELVKMYGVLNEKAREKYRP